MTVTFPRFPDWQGHIDAVALFEATDPTTGAMTGRIDLANLSIALSQVVPNADYIQAVSTNLNVSEWMRYFAVCSLITCQDQSQLARLGCPNAHVHCGDGTLGLPELAPFDAILVAAAAPAVPKPLLAQLAEGGRRENGITRLYSARWPTPARRSFRSASSAR